MYVHVWLGYTQASPGPQIIYMLMKLPEEEQE